MGNRECDNMSTQEGRKVYAPDETDKHEMAGRMYEAVDLQCAIENGHLNSIEEILGRLKLDADRLSEVLKLDTWVSSEDRLCLDLVDTIHRAEKQSTHLWESELSYYYEPKHQQDPDQLLPAPLCHSSDRSWYKYGAGDHGRYKDAQANGTGHSGGHSGPDNRTSE
jgi:hypothetical protein